MLSNRAEVLQALQHQLDKGVTVRTGSEFPSGSARLDAAAGIRRGTLTELIGEEGGGASTLAVALAIRACDPNRPLVVVDQQRRIYPPALAAMGIDLRRVVMTFPSNAKDCQWVLTQALACPAIAAVLCWPDQLGDRMFRRLQLAAEQGGSLGLIIRRTAALNEPSWADARLSVQPAPFPGQRRFRIHVLRSHGIGITDRSVEVEICQEGLLHDARPLHPVPRLASSTPLQRAARA